ncbi:MAG: hypothetical protein H7Y19_02120 [Luteimonas sp.]|nr:hypothetical protein [Luteimonas sp.]
MLLYLAAALFSAITLPWRGSADAFAHMDYVYQVHHGKLPEAFGYQYRKVDLRQFNIGNADKTNQWAASHPPLFYYLASLQMGRQLETGKWQVAVKRGRLLNVGIGFLCVMALSWAGWKLGGRHRAKLAIALPTIGGTLPIFVRLAGEIYNDLLVTLFSILALTLSCVILTEGPKRKYLISLALVCALGVASKATFLFALAIAMGAVFIAIAKQRGSVAYLRILLGVLASASLAIIAILPISWFYLKNYRASGSWFLSTPTAPIQNRTQSTALDVLANDDYWLLVPRSLLGPQWDSTWPVNVDVSIWLFVLCAVALTVLFMSRRHWRKMASLDWQSLAWLLLAAHFVGLMLAQWRHATGWGALNFRYFVPGMLSIALFLAAPAVAWERASGWLVGGLGSLMAASGVMWIITYLDRRYAMLAEGEGSWTRLLAAVESNGVPVDWVWVLLCIMGIGLVVVGWSVARAREAEAMPEVATHS